jgi:hypothetical protein
MNPIKKIPSQQLELVPASPLPAYASIAAMIADQANQLAGYVYLSGTKAYIKLSTNTASISDYFLVSSGSVNGSGTVGTLPVFTPDGATLGNSRVTQLGATETRVTNPTVDSYGVSFFNDVFKWLILFRNQGSIGFGIGNPDTSQENEINSVNYIGTRFNYDGFLRFVRVGTSGSFEALRLHVNGAAQFIRATLASITNAAAGFLIFDSGNSNRPTIHNGTAWRPLAYSGELGLLTPTERTAATVINASSHSLSYFTNTATVFAFSLSATNTAGMLCSINVYGATERQLTYDSNTVSVLGVDPINGVLRIQPATIDNGFTGVTIECMGLIAGKMTYKVYGNIKQS